VLTGDDADLTALPVHLGHGADGGPYISSSIDYVIDPKTGWTNVGVRRLMLRGRHEAGIDLVSPSDLRAIYEASVAAGQPLPVSFVVGAHPVDHLAAVMRLPVDELSLIACLRAAPLPVVKCVTNDIRVPADAEWVLEGYLDARGHVEPEGPYGEFLGYYGAVKRNPVFHLTAITRRRDALFQTATIGGRSLARTDTSPGLVTLNFSSPSANESLKIAQARTTWDSTSLLDNFVAKKTDDYATMQGQALTIYFFGQNQATWVNRGVWFSIEGTGRLSREQILKMAYSL